MAAPPASSPRSRLPLPAANHSATMNITKSGWSTKPSARRLLGSLEVDAPSARAASLASSAASHHTLSLLRSGRLDPHGIPPGNPSGIPPAPDGGGNPFPLAGIAAGQG